MKITSLFAALALVLNVSAADMILEPTTQSESGKEIAIIWIHGMQCKPEAYETIAKEFQAEASKNGYKAWIGAPEFPFDIPQPLTIDYEINGMISTLQKKHGFKGKQVYLAAHSLGGVMTQIFSKGKNDLVKGQILMGSVLLRNTRDITETGSTLFKSGIPPTLALTAELDGLLRISRGAESYFHGVVNVDKSQEGKYPSVALEGMSHAGFMDSTMLPSVVKNDDMNQEIDEKVGHNLVAKHMVSFIDGIEKGQSNSEDSWTKSYMKPLLDAMHLEGSYALKQPCYSKTLVNEYSPKCQHGSPWSAQAQKIMGGNIADKNVDISPQDNFHRVYTVDPVHLPQINNTCKGNEASKCILDSITVTENIYSNFDSFDTGKYEIGATEMKIKMMSRQSVQVKAGDVKSDFHADDEVGYRCADINKASLKWALDNAGSKALERYNKQGKKLVIGDDLGPYNAGPLWIWHYLTYTDNKDKTETLIQSPMMRTPTNYLISAAAGFHYCKILSPFRAMEWIYFDSQKDRNHLSTEIEQPINEHVQILQ